MLSNILSTTAALALWTGANAVCTDDPTTLLCYDTHNTTNITIADVAWLGWYLRKYGADNPDDQFYTMPAEETPDCEEWWLWQHGTALLLAKHIDPSVNSSVSYADIAYTIDGGYNSSGGQPLIGDFDNTLMACTYPLNPDWRAWGGSVGVRVNKSNPAYSDPRYPEGYMSDGILIKLVLFEQ